MKKILRIIEWFVNNDGENTAVLAGKEALKDMSMFKYVFSSVAVREAVS